MKNFLKNYKYNFFTLTPKLKEDRQTFWDFRIDDIAEMFPYYVGFGILFWVLYLINYLGNPTKVLLIQFFIFSCQQTIRLIVWLIGRRFKK